MTQPGLVVVVLIAGCAPAGNRGAATQDQRVQVLRQQVEDARAAINQLQPDDQADVRANMEALERDVEQFEALARRGRARSQIQAFLQAVVVVAAVDDATVVGTVDDAIIPLAVLAVALTNVVTKAPPPPAELEAAWAECLESMRALTTSISVATARRRPRRKLPPVNHCLKACETGPSAMEVFCRSLPSVDVRRACWKVIPEGLESCRGFCYRFFE